MTGLNQSKQLVKNRFLLILKMIKENEQIRRIEQEIALFVFDAIQLIQNKKISIKEYSNFFKKIIFEMNQSMHNKLSEETMDLLNESLLINESNLKFRSNINSILSIAVTIIQGNVKYITNLNKQKKPIFV